MKSEIEVLEANLAVLAQAILCLAHMSLDDPHKVQVIRDVLTSQLIPPTTRVQD